MDTLLTLRLNTHCQRDGARLFCPLQLPWCTSTSAQLSGWGQTFKPGSRWGHQSSWQYHIKSLQITPVADPTCALHPSHSASVWQSFKSWTKVSTPVVGRWQKSLEPQPLGPPLRHTKIKLDLYRIWIAKWILMSLSGYRVTSIRGISFQSYVNSYLFDFDFKFRRLMGQWVFVCI